MKNTTKSGRNAIVKYAAPKSSHKVTINKEEKTMKTKPAAKSVKQTVATRRNKKEEKIVKKTTRKSVKQVVKKEYTPEAFAQTPMRQSAVERIKEMGLATKIKNPKVKDILIKAQPVRIAFQRKEKTSKDLLKAFAPVAKLLGLEKISVNLGYTLSRAAGVFDTK